MSPDQEVKLFETIGRIDERTEQTNKAVEHLRNDIADLYGENKKDRENCEHFRSVINQRIDEREEKSVNKMQKAFENKHVRIGTAIGVLGILIGIGGIAIGF